MDDRTQAIQQDPSDQRAWEHWLRGIYPRVYYTIFGRTRGNASLSEELVQAALERFIRYQGLSKVENDADAVAYLTRTALRLWLDQRRLEVPATEGEEPSSPPPDDNPQLDLERLLGRLAPEDQQVVNMLRAGHTVGEIAKALGISYSAAGTRLHRIKAKLQNIAGEM